LAEMATAEWSELGGGTYYRRVEVYQMLWQDIELDKYVVAGAPYGGPIALVPDERKVLLLGERASATPKLRVFTAAGSLISSFTWPHHGLVAMGWSSKETLVCMLNDGSAYVYGVHGDEVGSFDMGPIVKREGVAECHMWSTGLVVRTSGRSEMFMIKSFDKPVPIKMADAGLTRPPCSMALIAPQLSLEHCPEVLLATAEGSVLVLDASTAQDQLIELGPFAKMSVSPSGNYIACFTDEGVLYVWPTDFSSNRSKIATGFKTPPKDIAWVGEEAVVMHWDKLIVLTGLRGDAVEWRGDSAMALVAEPDGVRIVSSQLCHFIERVAESTEAIFKIGATSPAALLYDAVEEFENQSVRADENVRSIKDHDQLRYAIEQCLNAAMHEFNPKTQTQLLKAASYGKLGCDDYEGEDFAERCRELRVMNAVRHPHVGIPITFQQYNKLGAEVLVDRLTNRHQHLLASRVCKYRNMDPKPVLVHWACAKVRASEDEKDAELAKSIFDKLANTPGISFSSIATSAYHAGRRALATMLLEQEPLASSQVPLLISFKEDELALKKAIDSGDTDLVYLVLLHIHKSHPFDKFFELIRDKPLARALFIAYCKQADLPALKRIYYLMQMPVEAANVSVIEAYQSENWSDRMSKLDIALNFYANKDVTDPFPAKATAEQMALLKHEAELMRESKDANDDSFIDLSVSGLIEHHILNARPREAMNVKNKFKVPDVRLWHIEVRTLAKCQAWSELAKLTANKKSPPIGFLPFIEACVEQKAFGEAAKYITRLDDPTEQIEWFCNIGFFKEAAEVAAKERDVESLQTIRAACAKNAPVLAFIDRVLSGQAR